MRRSSVWLLALCALLPAAARAQTPQAVQDELALIRDATIREQAGDFAQAEALLGRVLKQNPQSLSALLSLERVLRMENKLSLLIPFVETHLKSDPTSAIGHQMLVRALSSLDNVADLERAADSWIKQVPKLETPYREIARVWQQRGDYSRALQVLELGRSRVGSQDALALELGDAYAALEEYGRAVREWDRAIGPEARGLLLVQRRIAAMRDGGAQALPALVDLLMRHPGTFQRKRAAAQLAIDAGLSDRAEQVLKESIGYLRGFERQAYLVEMARRADSSNLPRVAFWAYSQLTLGEMSPDQSLAVRGRIAELALAVGDTAVAARSYRELEQSLSVGSPQRRQAVALRMQLMIREGKLEEAGIELAEFRREYPTALELDAVAANLAGAYLDRDDVRRAEDAISGANGPRSGIARGRIALRRGDVAAAKSALLTAAPSLHGAEATETIRLMTLLGKVSRAGGELVGKSLAKVGGGALKEAIIMLEQGVDSLPELERPAVLDFAAAIADRAQMPLESNRMRRRIVTDHPRSSEAPASLLALARSSTRAEATEEARKYLETLILEYPRSALVPQARQELDRLQGRVPRS